MRGHESIAMVAADGRDQKLMECGDRYDDSLVLDESVLLDMFTRESGRALGLEHLLRNLLCDNNLRLLISAHPENSMHEIFQEVSLQKR